MRKVDRFQVVRSRRAPKPEIILADNAGVVLRVEAAGLLASYELDPSAVLLVLDEDCPFEERIHLVLVRHGRKADHIAIGAPYTAGVFQEVDHGNDGLRFRFASEGVWTATVRDRGIFLVPRLPRGAGRQGNRWGPHRLLLAYEEDRR